MEKRFTPVESSKSNVPASIPLDPQFREFEFLNFAAWRRRKRCDEIDIPGNFEFRDPAAAKTDNFFRRDRRALLQLRRDRYFLAEKVARHPVDVGFTNRRMSQKQFLNFARRNVFAASNDDVFAPAGDAHITLCIHDSEITGPEPSIAYRTFCLLRFV